MPVAERADHAAGDVDAELDVGEHPLGPRRTELLRAGQEHDHRPPGSGPAPTRPGPGAIAQPRPEDWPPWSNGRAIRPPVRRQTQRDQQHGDDQQSEHGGIGKAHAWRSVVGGDAAADVAAFIARPPSSAGIA